MSSKKTYFRFIDLFAGVGGFHSALSHLGGECVYAVEKDPAAAAVYDRNWTVKGRATAFGDITNDADEALDLMKVPEHDVLCAGFPCQPFSKSGAQRGMDEARGTLFFNIASIIRAHHPSIVLLENVRNLIGPRHEHEWEVIIRTLREEGYNVSAEPAIFSPHILPEHMGGAPQVRERVFITATYFPESVPKTEGGEVDAAAVGPIPVVNMRNRFPRSADDSSDFIPGDPEHGWNLLDESKRWIDNDLAVPECDLKPIERLWIDAWDDFTVRMRDLTGEPLKGFPYWADSWADFVGVKELFNEAMPRPLLDPATGLYRPVPDDPSFPTISEVVRPAIENSLPPWKKSHLRRNYDEFTDHWRDILIWARKWGVYTELFPASRRKLEWQAQDTKSLWDTVMHFRPSGIRAKRPTYVPALVAITQTSILGRPFERRLAPREAARLQGLPDSFDFGFQSAAATYRQMGNGVNAGVVAHVFTEHVRRDRNLLLDLDEKLDGPKRDAGRAIVAALERASRSKR